MTDVNEAGAAPAATPFADEQTPINAIDLFRNMRAAREEEQRNAEASAEQTQQAEAAPETSSAEPDDESAHEANAATAEGQSSGEGEGQDDTADLPPIAPPSSWTKEEKAAFAALPREHQQTIADRERARRAEVDRRLNEISRAEQAAKAREDAAEQARKQYEDQLPVIAQALQGRLHDLAARMQAEFSDVKSLDDLDRMAEEDPIRHGKWQAYERRVQAEQARLNQATADYEQAQQRRMSEETAEKRRFFEEQNKLFLEHVPEFADPVKAAEIRLQAVDTLADLGFEAADIDSAWNSGGSIPVHDHRFQLLVRKASLYDKAQKAVRSTAPAPKPVPQVQRPGPASSNKDMRSEQIKTLDSKLSKTGNIRDALALMRARRAAG